MSLNPASCSTINFVEQCLLKSIASENSLPRGLFGDPLKQARWEPPQALDLNELRPCISATVELLKHRLLETAAAICQHHNSHLPIQRLPPEILSACIDHAMVEIDGHNHQKRLIQLSTVSSWWRKVTLGTPSLWGVVHSKDPDWIVSLALDRSKDSPLSVLWEVASDTGNLRGGESHRDSIGAGDFFRLVCPHTNRWRDVTLPRLGPGCTSTDWLNQHKIQLSRHLQRLSLCWDGSASKGDPITGFSGLAERLLELKLHKLHVHPPDIRRILAASSRLVTLDLESLVALDEEETETQPENEPNGTSRAAIDLPYLTRLNLKWLPSSLLYPIVRNLNPTDKIKVSLTHSMATQSNQDTTPESKPFASFIAHLIATQRWVTVHPQSTKVIITTRSCSTNHYSVDLRGPPSVILPWLRLRCLPQITREHSVLLRISSDDLGGDPDRVVIENLMRFPKVGYVNLLGSRESWRWAWLLSLPDAIQMESASSQKRGGSWIWPELMYLNVNGDLVNEFTLISVLLARYGQQSTGESTTKQNHPPRRLEALLVRPRERVWRAEVLDRIRELVVPGCFKWKFDSR
ncbi:hypothetical protein M407DRAFT_27976 [Tulasnella calospora MUT 4182]|uniref:F-box domain-containing protein n=1 Tax=Tulasnella calospora MUT 4182 TaxID=1051891 RepID=A0A0C3Q265_9AGAM|nr:hypothetical protein M407DRAFT_27976 [Tulasnella calospora MUT 4182]